MKQVINGKLFDTARSQQIHNWCNGNDTGNFHYEEETLYKSKGGIFFLWVEGGAASAWKTYYPADRRSGWGEQLIVLGGDNGETNEQAALKWCEERECEADVIAKYFQVQEA